MKLNSRGRAALREAHGLGNGDFDPERVAQRNGLTLSGSFFPLTLTVGFAQSRSPTAINFGPFRT